MTAKRGNWEHSNNYLSVPPPFVTVNLPVQRAGSVLQRVTLHVCVSVCPKMVQFWYNDTVQNAATRLVTGTRRCDHISPVLRQLHWLPVQQRVVFKIATLVHRSLSGNAAGYLADDCQLVADARVRQLRSANTRTLVVSRTRSSFGDRTFAAAEPQVCRPISDYHTWAVIWPVQAVTEDIIWIVRPRRSVNCFNCAEYKYFTYLLNLRHAKTKN